MDKIADALNAQGTSALTRYNGNGPVSTDPLKSKLEQLLEALQALLDILPPDIAAMLSGVIADAVALLDGGGSAVDISLMIDRLQQITRQLQELMMQLQQLQTSGDGQIDPALLQAVMRGLAAQIDGNQRAAVMLALQKLRKLAVGGTLKGIDEVNLGSLDGTSLVEPNLSNVMQSLQKLIGLSLSARPPANPVDATQAAALQAGAVATAALPPSGGS